MPLGYSDGLCRAHIISPGASDATQIRTPAAASFLQDVALRDLAVHATHAVCVDGRGDVYQWGDGFFGQEEDRPPGGTPVLTLQGKVRPSSPHALADLIFRRLSEYQQGAGHRITRLCAFSFWEGIRDTGACSQPRYGSGAVQFAVVEHGLVVGRGNGSSARRDRTSAKARVGREVSIRYFALIFTTPTTFQRYAESRRSLLGMTTCSR